MPLTEKGETIKRAMQKEYGPEKGESVLYASQNAGTITGIDADPEWRHDMPDCGDQAVSLAPLVMPPDPSPRPLEHPQLHPDASTPPSSADQTPLRSAYGGEAGGSNPYGTFGAPGVQVWGQEAPPVGQVEMAHPEATLADLQQANEELWRPHGVAPGEVPKVVADRYRGGSFRRR